MVAMQRRSGMEEGPIPHAERAIIAAVADLSYKRRLSELMLDVVLIALAYYGAYALRWDADLPPEQVRIFGSCDLPQLIHQHRVHEVLISSAKIPDHKLEDRRRLGVAWKRVHFPIE
jgi:hypothetical protein